MNNLFPEQAQQELQSLADRQKKLFAECEEWYEKYAHPVFSDCHTIAEYQAARREMPQISDEKGFMDLPGLIQVNLAFVLHRIREEENK